MLPASICVCSCHFVVVIREAKQLQSAPRRAVLNAGRVNAKNLFTELKRRNVYRAAVAYGVVAWFLTQLTTQVFPFFEIPNSAVRFVVIALTIGFPIAMLLSWIYELTPEGVVRTEDLDPARAKSVQRKSGRLLDFIIIGALLLVIAMLIVGRVPFYKQTGQTIPQKSIAVLPFENLSRDPDNAYFADGIQEEILTRLAGIADLKVISRSSTHQYQSKARNLAQIAKQLGVANIVEGSVQRAANQVRVNVQLIHAQTDSHLWADTYDRKLIDIFGVESEIAKRIAESLRTKLTGREQQALAVKPTNNAEAYDAYLHGVAFEARSRYPFLTEDLARQATGFYERAVQLDPSFAAAWARLSRAHAFLDFGRVYTSVAVRGDAAKRALDNAQRLEPNSAETLLALGYYQYWVLSDYGLAKTTFERVSKMLPNSSEVLLALARIARREGDWGQSVVYNEQALNLDPRNTELLGDTAWNYSMLRRFAEALKIEDRVLDIMPNNPVVIADKASLYQGQRNLQQAGALLAGLSEHNSSVFRVKITQLRLARDYQLAVQLFQARPTQFHFDSETEKAFDRLAFILVQQLAGDAAGARFTAEQASNILEQLCREQPQDPYLASLLSQAYAALGEKESALKEAERAIMLSPSAKNAVDGPAMEENLAIIQTMFGENSSAISSLARLLRTPGNPWLCETPVTPALLRLDPIWDPLRSDPAFQKLCEEKQP